MSTETDRVPWTPQLLRVMAGLMLSLFVAAMDATVVGTSLPTIARELGSFELYPWIVSGYLITATTTVPIWGRLRSIPRNRTTGRSASPARWRSCGAFRPGDISSI